MTKPITAVALMTLWEDTLETDPKRKPWCKQKPKIPKPKQKDEEDLSKIIEFRNKTHPFLIESHRKKKDEIR